ncbi:hypothetical protein OTU49_005013, partial [Cherax quadricarinatus]
KELELKEDIRWRVVTSLVCPQYRRVNICSRQKTKGVTFFSFIQLTEKSGRKMDGEEGGEEGLTTAAGAWTTATYQTQELSNVVHIIVPDLTCIPQGQPNDALATALNEVANGGALVGHEENGHSQVKDPLSALAAAAELDQVRNDVAVVSFAVNKRCLVLS